MTGTQTSGKPCMSLDDFCVVTACDPVANRVESHGRTMPSSESLTHGAIYSLGPHIRVVLHAHSPVIWRRARALRIPTTDPSVPYGTQRMAQAVERLYATTHLPECRMLTMGGHEDGVICFGKSAEEAGEVLLRYLARAYGQACAEGDGTLCAT